MSNRADALQDFPVAWERIVDIIHCHMKPAIYLTDPEEMRKARLNQPRVSSEQLRSQREAFRRASEKFSAAARKEISSRGRASKTA